MTAQPLRMFCPSRRRVAAPLLCALVLAAAAGTAQAQPPTCQDGENRVQFQVGQISPYEVQPGVQALRITAAGSSGGAGSDGFVGGPGAVLKGTVAVTEGRELRVLVGTAGGAGSGGGGGGGSFVGVGAVPGRAFSTEALLVVAGGGGGGSPGGAGGSGGTLDGGEGGAGGGGGGGRADGTGGTGLFGTGDGGGAMIGDDGADGDGGSADGAGGGGAGGNGGNSVGGVDETIAFGGQAAVNGGTGGAGTEIGGDGGFGGGGGAGHLGAGGAGSGYAGGAGGISISGGGGGGSSYFADAVSERSMEATNHGNGYVIFCEIPAAPELTFDPASLDFGEVVAGESRAISTTLTNTGQVAANNLNFAISGEGFEISSNSCQTTLEAGGGCAL